MFYGAAEFSRDSDFAILADAEIETTRIMRPGHAAVAFVSPRCSSIHNQLIKWSRTDELPFYVECLVKAFMATERFDSLHG